MEKKNRAGRLPLFCLLFALLCAAAVMIPAGGARAATKDAINKKAKTEFSKRLKNAKGLEVLKYADVTGDGIVEALLECHAGGGSGRTFRLYTYTHKTGKVTRVLTMGEYGLSRIYAYPKTKSLVLWGAGHGGEWYAYYTLKNGKYTLLAQRARMSKAGGSDKNGAWSYSKLSKDLTKAQFTKAIKGIAAGTRKTVKLG